MNLGSGISGSLLAILLGHKNCSAYLQPVTPGIDTLQLEAATHVGEHRDGVCKILQALKLYRRGFQRLAPCQFHHHPRNPAFLGFGSFGEVARSRLRGRLGCKEEEKQGRDKELHGLLAPLEYTTGNESCSQP